MGNARRESAAKAAAYARKNFPDSDSVFVIMEPEKEDLIRWIPDLIAPIVEGRAMMVFPRRNEDGWKSYPSFQADEEKVANMVFYEMTGVKADPMLGPIVFHKELSGYFAECQPKEKYGVPDNYLQHVAPMEIIRDGFPVEVVEIGFIYPPEQKAEEEGPKFAEMVKKRLSQQSELVQTYFKVGKTILPHPNIV